MMTEYAQSLAQRLQAIFLEMAELEKTAPADVDVLVSVMIGHLRSWRPVSVAPLGVLPEPDEPPVDPRTVTKPLKGKAPKKP